jgi:hypothetical protein
MAEPSLVVQGWLVSTLKALPALSGVGVYDQPPGNVQPPYVIVGDCQVLPDRSEDSCKDAFDVFNTIQFYTKGVGYPILKGYASAGYDALHEAEPTLSGFTVDECFCDTIEYLREPDGISRRARFVLNMRLHAA